MNIGRKERLVTGIGLTAVAIIAAAIWWSETEVDNANRQRRVTSEIARALTDLTLATFEYRLYRNERTRMQWDLVSDRVNRMLASAERRDPAQSAILAGVRDRRVAGQRLFTEIKAVRTGTREETALDDSSRRFESQLLSQLLAIQQENVSDILGLNTRASERIVDAQRRVLAVIAGGLALIAAIIVGASWFLRGQVLAPLAGLLKGTRQLAAGNLDFTHGLRRNDEIGELSRNFDAMTGSLRASFALIGRSNRDLAVLNEELKAFSYSVSHDLRGPLRSMDGFSQVLLEDYGDKLDAEGKDALARIRAASQRMGGLIDDLLRLSQVTRAGLKLAPVDLSAVAREIADTIDREHPDRHAQWDVEAGLRIEADLPLARIAMQNLLQNAWKFSGNKDSPAIRVGATGQGASREYFVGDNGVGFDMAHAENLFGAFQRLHHAADFPGTGIGLAIVQRIVHRHGGRIRAEAKQGEGATFFFTFKESDHGTDEQVHPAG